MTAVRDGCGCDFTMNDIIDGFFSCPNATVEVTYRASVRGNVFISSAPFLRLEIQNWVQTGPVIKDGKLLLDVDPTCSATISSLADPKCPDSAPLYCGYSG